MLMAASGRKIAAMFHNQEIRWWIMSGTVFVVVSEED